MGKKQSKIAVEKDGIPYTFVRKELRPLDLILFKGEDFVSDIIRYMEGGQEEGYIKCIRQPKPEKFSHCGILITRDVFNDSRLEYGKFYILEATAGGKLGQDVLDINGRTFIGVQIRDFDKLVYAYDSSPKTRIAWCKLKNNPCYSTSIRNKITPYILQKEGSLYDFNLFDLFSIVFPFLRSMRNCVGNNYQLMTKPWVICSELAFGLYQYIGLYNSHFDARDVSPTDFIENDIDGIPMIFEKPRYIVAR